MSKDGQNKEFNHKLLLIAALAIAFLSACDSQSSPAGSQSSDTVSSSAVESSESSAQEQTPAVEADSQLPDDGKLRVADSPSEGSGTTVFCGSQIVYDGDGSASAFEGDEYFYVRRIVGDEYRSTIYNRDGEQLLEVPGGYPQLIGKWLIFAGDIYGTAVEPTVYNIETLEQVPLGDGVKETQSFFEFDGYICSVVFDTGATDTTIYSGEDLSVVAEFPGYSGSSAYNIDGFVSMSKYDEETGNSQTIYYSPSDGTTYENVMNVCGKNLLTIQVDGDYQVCDVTTGETVAEGKNYTYYSDAVKIWQDFGNNTFVDAPCYDGEKEVSYAWCNWSSGDPYINVNCLDGSVEVLNLSGELVNSCVAKENKSLIYTNGGMIVENQADGIKPGVTLYFPDGKEKQFDCYNWLNTVLQDKLMVGSYQFGQKYLYDLLDTEGNILIEGLSNYNYPQGDGPIYVCKGFSYGFMDTDGNWLWKRSIFDSAVDESDSTY